MKTRRGGRVARSGARALAIGALAVRRMAIGRLAVGGVDIDELSVRKLRVADLDVSGSARFPVSAPDLPSSS